MANFDPERDGWSLCEAVRRTAAAWALAALHRDLIDAAAAGIQHEPIDWWHMTDPPPPPPMPAHDPPRPVPIIEMEDGRCWLLTYGIEQQFLHKLDSGELPYWGRLGSVLSDYRRVPPFAGVRIESWWKSGGIIRLESGEFLYTVRVEPLIVEIKPPSPAAVEEWYREYVRSGSPISDRAEDEASQKHFGRQVPRARRRDIRVRVLRELRPNLFDDNGALKTGRRT